MPEPIENVKKEITLVESSSEASVQTEGVKAQPCFIAHLLDMDKRQLIYFIFVVDAYYLIAWTDGRPRYYWLISIEEI
jgi:hypothetical protein